MTPSQIAADPRDVVLKLIEIISGTQSVESASDCLESDVLIHMDSAVHRGIVIWRKWIHLIRQCGRVRELRLEPSQIAVDPADAEIVDLTFRWCGEKGRPQVCARTCSNLHHLRYRVQNFRIVEIWSRKQNYVFIFGSWVRFSFGYRLLLLWAIFYFAAQAGRRAP